MSDWWPFATEQGATNFALDHLRARGYSCRLAESGDWTTPGALSRELDMPSSTLAKRLKHPRCPAYIRDIGPTGRLKRLRVSPELRAFLSATGAPGKAFLHL